VKQVNYVPEVWEYPGLLKEQKSNAVGAKSGIEFAEGKIPYALRSESWQPGHLHPNLSWTHYRTLLRVEKAEKAMGFFREPYQGWNF